MSTDIKQYKICVEKHASGNNTLRDIHYSLANRSMFYAQKIHAAFVIGKIWTSDAKIRIGFFQPDVKVYKTPIKIDQDVDPLTNQINNLSAIDTIKLVVNERIKPIVGLDIQFVDDIKQANVRISFNNNEGCWSYIGTDHLIHKYPEPTMNFGWIDVATIIHEFGHLLGMIHEHINPIGQSIDWDKPAVYEWASQTQGWDKSTTNENIFNHYNINLLNGSEFDPLSIMLYFFPDDLTLNHKGTRQNFKLSAYDVLWMNNIYKQNAPEDPFVFYKKIYGITLQDALSKSDRARFLFNLNYKVILNTILYIILLFLLISVIILLILKK
jgi:hypothetical protein